MPYASVNGIRMHYETYGAGDPVLLVSGLGGPAVGWLFRVRDLSQHCHVVAFDNRGVGETDMPRELSYATGELAEDARDRVAVDCSAVVVEATAAREDSVWRQR